MTSARPPARVGRKPFEARLEWTFIAKARGTTDQNHGAMYRDNEGRLRFEYPLWSGEQIAVIFDPLRRERISLDELRREANILPDESSVLQRTWTFADCLPTFTEDYRIVNGVRCRRVLLKTEFTRSDLGETWISEPVGLVMSELLINDGCRSEWRVTSIEFKEQHPSLFVVPSSYHLFS